MTLPQAFLTTPVAHRGLHSPGVPENSMAAFRAAIDHGYAIEMDIQHAADGTPLVVHDYDLSRLADNAALVAGMSMDEIALVRLLETEEGIPTLAEVLAEVAGRVPLLIEIKDQDGKLGRDTGKLQDRVAALLADYDGPVAVMSFNPNTVEAFGRVAPGIPRGITSCAYQAEDWPMLDDATRARLAEIGDFDRSGSCFVSHDWHDLDNPRIAELKAQGVPILCWTIRSPEAESEARRVADNITFEGYLP